MFCIASMWYIGLVCSLYLITEVLDFGLCSVSLYCGTLVWSVVCISSLRYIGLVCGLSYLTEVPWFGLWSISFHFHLFTVVCFFSITCLGFVCGLYLFTEVPGFGLWSVSVAFTGHTHLFKPMRYVPRICLSCLLLKRGSVDIELGCTACSHFIVELRIIFASARLVPFRDIMQSLS